MRAMRLAALPCLALLLASPAAAATLLDDFESATSPEPWRFASGAEFPGAKGSLSSGPGHTGKGLWLAYDLTSGGRYVQASRTFNPKIDVRALSFWVKSPVGIQVAVRVTDSTGQTLQLRAGRPLESTSEEDWYRVFLDVTSATTFWGGANDGVLHGPVSQVALLAADPVSGVGSLSGAVGFDDLAAADQPTVALLDPFATPLAPRVPGDDLAAELGVNIHFTKDDRALEAARLAGFSFVRMDLFWSAVERQAGVYDFAAYDGLVAALEARGMGALFILDYGNALHEDCAGCSPQSAATVTAFGAFAEAAARHFAGKPVRFEVWNEPNIGFWKPAPDAAQYAALLTEAVKRVHQGNPSAKVSTGGLAGMDLPFAASAFAQGAARNADAIGVHPYRQGGAESLGGELLRFRAAMAPLAPGVPIWDTEWGYSSTWYGDGHDDAARQRQAQLTVRRLLVSRALGMPMAVYYDLRDDGDDPAEKEHNFGLLARDYSEKPAYRAARASIAQVKGRRFAGFLPLEPSTLHALRLDGDQDVRIALWTEAMGQTIGVRVPEPTAAVDQYGEALALADGQVQLAESAGPVFLTFPRPPPADAAIAGPDAAPDAGMPPDARPPEDAATPAGADAQTVAQPDVGRPAPYAPEGCGCGNGAALGWAGLLGLAALWLRPRRRVE